MIRLYFAVRKVCVRVCVGETERDRKGQRNREREQKSRALL